MNKRLLTSGLVLILAIAVLTVGSIAEEYDYFVYLPITGAGKVPTEPPPEPTATEPPPETETPTLTNTPTITVTATLTLTPTVVITTTRGGHP